MLDGRLRHETGKRQRLGAGTPTRTGGRPSSLLLLRRRRVSCRLWRQRHSSGGGIPWRVWRRRPTGGACFARGGAVGSHPRRSAESVPTGKGAAMQQPILVLSASLTHTSRCRCVCRSLTACTPLLAQTKTPSATPGGKRSRATLQLPRSAPACLCVSRGLRPSRAPTSAAASDAPVTVVVHQAVADIIRTTLGPQSMLKMLLDASGGASWTRLPRVVCPTLTVSGRLRPARLTPGIVLTNDGNAILREIDVSHPAAKARGPRLWRLLRGVAPPGVLQLPVDLSPCPLLHRCASAERH